MTCSAGPRRRMRREPRAPQRRVERLQAVMQPPARRGTERPDAVGLLVQDVERDDRLAGAKAGNQRRIVRQAKIIRNQTKPTCPIRSDTPSGNRLATTWDKTGGLYIQGLQMDHDGRHAGLDGQPVQHPVLETIALTVKAAAGPADPREGHERRPGFRRRHRDRLVGRPGGADRAEFCSVTSIRKASPMTSASNIRSKEAALACDLSIR